MSMGFLAEFSTCFLKLLAKKTSISSKNIFLILKAYNFDKQKLNKMKKFLTPILFVAVAAITLSLTSCKSKPKDVDIKAAIEKALSADPMTVGTAVSVEKGVATISGVCKDEMCKTSCEKIVSGIKGVKSVVNNCTIVPAVDAVVNATDEILTKGLADALKDNPTVKSAIADGKIVLTGEIAKAKWMVLKPILDNLKSKGYDLTGLKIK